MRLDDAETAHLNSASLEHVYRAKLKRGISSDLTKMMVRLQVLMRHPGTGEARNPGALMMQFWSRPGTELESLEDILAR